MGLFDMFKKKKDKGSSSSDKSSSKSQGKSEAAKPVFEKRKPKAVPEAMGGNGGGGDDEALFHNILTSDELDEVSGAVQMATGNFGDDWGNMDISNDSIAKMDGDSNNPLFSGTGSYFTAGIGGALSLYGNVNTLMDKNASKLDKAAAGFGAIESGATMGNKLTLGTEQLTGSTWYQGTDGLTGAAVGVQSAGALAGGIGDTLGTISSAKGAYKDYKDGKKYDAAIGAAQTLKSGLGAVDKSMKAIHGISEIATKGTSAMGQSTALTGTAANISTGLGVASAGIGAAIGAAQMTKGGYDIYKASKVKDDLKKMDTSTEGSSEVINTLIQGQNDKQKSGIENIVEGGIAVTSGILGIIAITGVGAPFAAAVGLIGGLAMGGYKLHKYWTGSRKQKKVDKIVDKFFHTSMGVDYAPFLDGGGSYKDYKAKRLKDISNEKKVAKKNKSDEDKKQEGKGFFKKVFSENTSKKSQKALDKIDKREKKYENMTEEEFEQEVAGVNKVYNDSTHAKKIDAYEQAEAALRMLESISGEDRTKLLKALKIKDADFESKKNDDGKTVSTSDAEKTKMIADKLMGILSQKKIESM